MNEILKQRFPFISNYFQTLFENAKDKFPQSIVFEGLDIFGQLYFTTELARILNCEQGAKADCDCINCRWIKEGKHPAITYITPIDFKGDGDASKTVISVAQTKKITQVIRESSDFHRFFIFLNASNRELGEQEKAMLEPYLKTDFNFLQENWAPGPINSKIFKAEASNSLLKSIEEPSGETTFVFLTSTREDLINTIVSRSNVFKLPGLNIKCGSATIKDIFANYPNLSLSKSLEISENLLGLVKSGGLEPSAILESIQEHLLSLLKSNLNNKSLVNKINKDIKTAQTAKRRLGALISPKNVFESLMIDLSNSND